MTLHLTHRAECAIVPFVQLPTTDRLCAGMFVSSLRSPLVQSHLASVGALRPFGVPVVVDSRLGILHGDGPASSLVTASRDVCTADWRDESRCGVGDAAPTPTVKNTVSHPDTTSAWSSDIDVRASIN